jgi:hypothetical protein
MNPTTDQMAGGDEMLADQMLAGLDLGPCASKTEQMEAIYGYVHTGRYIREQQPEKFQRIMLGLKEGMAVEHIAKLCGCSHNTVDALIDTDFPGGRTAYDAVMVAQLQRISRRCADKILTLIPKCDDPKALAIVMGITEEKLAQRRGTPGLVVQMNHQVEGSGAWHAKFEAIKQAAAERQNTIEMAGEEDTP